MKSTLRFSAKINVIGINPYVLVTKKHSGTLKPGWKKPMPVLVQISKRPKARWRTNLMPRGDGSFYLYLHGGMRKAVNTKPGDRITIVLKFDSDYRGGPSDPMPAWFRNPIKKNKKALASWRALPPSRKKEILRYFARLKSADARKRNLERALSVLSGKPGRFMARDWKNGK